MSSCYWVVGGRYVDSNFTTIAPGTSLERIGPFASYAEAHKAWQAKAWATVDNATKRYVIFEDPPPEEQ